MQMVIPSSARLFEKAWPAAAGLVAGIVTFAFAPLFFKIAAQEEWDVGTVYSSIFDVATVFTAFTFTFYSFILTKETGFIAKMRHTYAYRECQRFALAALSLGAVLILFSIPMMVVVPAPVEESSHGTLLIVAIWAALSAWTIGAFVRAAYMFSLLAGHRG